MREMAGELAKRIGIPSLSDKNLWRDLPVEFKPGKYYLPIGMVEIDRDKQVKVTYPDLAAGIAEPYLVTALLSHLNTSGIAELSGFIGDDGKLQELKACFEIYSRLLMMYLKAIVDEVDGLQNEIAFSW